MANTGFKIFLQRGKYIDGVFSGTYVQNTEFLEDGTTPDPDYVAKVQDLTLCPLAVTVYSCSLGPTNSGLPICTVGTNVTYYKDTAGTPIVGTQFYTDFGGTTQWTGGDGNWWKYNNTDSVMLRIAGGNVSAVTACSG